MKKNKQPNIKLVVDPRLKEKLGTNKDTEQQTTISPAINSSKRIMTEIENIRMMKFDPIVAIENEIKEKRNTEVLKLATKV
jgi:hypothetical protein